MDKTDPQATAPAGLQAGTQTPRAASGGAGANVLPEHTRLEGCEIVGLIGAGEYSIVYLAYDYALARHIAVKEYMPFGIAVRSANGHVAALAPDDQELFRIGLQSFISEARLLARFDAPSLVKILRLWEANGTAYMAMPHYDGVTLLDAVGSGRFDANEKRVRLLLEQLFDAVDRLNRSHCQHPDIAPGNIRLLADGRPLLLDFGASRRAIKAHTVGPAAALRPGFAPIEDYEDIANLKRGPWTDVYALAAVAYFMIAGKAPPPAPERMTQDALAPAREVGAARYGDAFLAAIDRALAVMPQQRPQSVAEFRRALGMPVARRQDAARAAQDGDTSTLRWPAANAARPGHGGAVHPASRVPGMRSAALAMLVLALLAAAGFYGVRRTEPVAAGADAAGPAQTAAAAPAEAALAGGPAAQAPAAPAAPSAAAAAPTAPAETPEDTRWRVASSLNNASAYENYLADYPNGRYAPVARAALDSLRSAAEPGLSVADPAQQEESLWNAVRRIDKPLAYESFLRKYPNGRYAAAARGSLARLRLPAAEPRLPFEPPVVDATRRPDLARPGGGLPAATASAPAGPLASAAPAVSVAPAAPVVPAASAASPAAGAPRPTDRQAAVRPAETPAAGARQSPPAAPTADPDSDAEPLAAPVPARERRTLRLANQNMTGNFAPDPVTGLVSGSGRIVWDNGDQFEGTLVRGQKEGRGEFRWANGQRYRGDWARDQPNGRGSIHFPNGDRYVGDVRNGLPNGSGTLTFANGNRYQGEVRDGQPNGTGVLTFSNGNRYRGEVRDGLPNGIGTNRYANGDTYTGAWRRGRSDGQGRYTWANGDAWEGEFRDDAKTANGRLVAARDAAGAGAASAGESSRGSAAGGNPDDERDVRARAR